MLVRTYVHDFEVWFQVPHLDISALWCQILGYWHSLTAALILYQTLVGDTWRRGTRKPALSLACKTPSHLPRFTITDQFPAHAEPNSNPEGRQKIPPTSILPIQKKRISTFLLMKLSIPEWKPSRLRENSKPNFPLKMRKELREHWSAGFFEEFLKLNFLQFAA